jgi:hypothetical protein
VCILLILFARPVMVENWNQDSHSVGMAKQPEAGLDQLNPQPAAHDDQAYRHSLR